MRYYAILCYTIPCYTYAVLYSFMLYNTKLGYEHKWKIIEPAAMSLEWNAPKDPVYHRT